MTQSDAQLHAGTRVVVACPGSTGTALPIATHDTVAGVSIFDRFTMQMWVPVQIDGAADDSEPRLVKREHVRRV
ncbi:hypothetical protein CFP71_15150 [Amycolatopsis thailandensis]|uniref:Uncharacterized protein n=1 Tax=Amycolatopsis thailandensis TaxID=589330 RepID=A0A229SB34_9PSEU|nr:hypothetical protein [Amycolatopsis thailandensis]OXM56152.1 hypothetical protein CFP71_15150 [Amycolatopsis thailandensis]